MLFLKINWLNDWLKIDWLNSFRLLSFCEVAELVITGFWFRRTACTATQGYWTTGKAKNELDHILTRHRNIKSSYKVHALRHRSRGEYSSPPLHCGDHPIRQHKPTSNINVQALASNPTLTDKYINALKAKLYTLNDLPDDPEIAWATVSDIIQAIPGETIGHRRHRRQSWLSDEAMDTLDVKAKSPTTRRFIKEKTPKRHL